MSRYVAKLGEDAYCEWSTVVDAPIWFVTTRVKAVALWTEARVARADRNGTSILDGCPAGTTPEEIVRGNRAGRNEEELTVAEIIYDYSYVNRFDHREVRAADAIEDEPALSPGQQTDTNTKEAPR